MLAHLMYADLADTKPDDRHWLPVVRFEAVLQAIELLPRLAPRDIWKLANAMQAVAAPGDELHGGLYISFGIERQCGAIQIACTGPRTLAIRETRANW